MTESSKGSEADGGEPKGDDDPDTEDDSSSIDRTCLVGLEYKRIRPLVARIDAIFEGEVFIARHHALQLTKCMNNKRQHWGTDAREVREEIISLVSSIRSLDDPTPVQKSFLSDIDTILSWMEIREAQTSALLSIPFSTDFLAKFRCSAGWRSSNPIMHAFTHFSERGNESKIVAFREQQARFESMLQVRKQLRLPLTPEEQQIRNVATLIVGANDELIFFRTILVELIALMGVEGQEDIASGLSYQTFLNERLLRYHRIREWQIRDGEISTYIATLVHTLFPEEPPMHLNIDRVLNSSTVQSMRERVRNRPRQEAFDLFLNFLKRKVYHRVFTWVEEHFGWVLQFNRQNIEVVLRPNWSFTIRIGLLSHLDRDRAIQKSLVV